MDLLEAKPIVYTAHSRHLFYARMLISKYVIMQNAVPLNPFNIWGYFLYELVDRDLVRRGNNNILRVADETWVFGPVADGVLAEIEYTMALGKELAFFSAGSEYEAIAPVDVDDLEFEPDVLRTRSAGEITDRIRRYMTRGKA